MRNFVIAGSGTLSTFAAMTSSAYNLYKIRGSISREGYIGGIAYAGGPEPGKKVQMALKISPNEYLFSIASCPHKSKIDAFFARWEELEAKLH
jgi:hypothetical protein